MSRVDRLTVERADSRGRPPSTSPRSAPAPPGALAIPPGVSNAGLTRLLRQPADAPPAPAPAPESQPAQGEMPEQAKADMDQYVTDVTKAIDPYFNWKGDPNRTGAVIPGPREVETTSKNAKIQSYALPELKVAARDYARKKIDPATLQAIEEAGSIADYPYGEAEELLGVKHKPAEHHYRLTLSQAGGGSLVDKGLAKLGTRISITYTNRLDPGFGFVKEYVVTGFALSAGVSYVATVRRFLQDFFTEGPGPDQEHEDWHKKWGEMAKDPRKAFTSEQGKPVDIGLDLDLLSLQIGTQGIDADKPAQYWSPQDIVGAVLVPRLGRFTAAAGPAQVQAVGMDAISFAGSGQMATGELSFPNINPTFTPPEQIWQGLGGATFGLIIDLKLVELGVGYAKLLAGGP